MECSSKRKPASHGEDKILNENPELKGKKGLEKEARMSRWKDKKRNWEVWEMSKAIMKDEGCDW